MKTEKDFGLRFFAAPSPGQIGPTEHHRVTKATSLAAAKRGAQAFAMMHEWRLIEVFEIQPHEQEQYRAWYGGAN